MARKSKYPAELKERAVAMVRELERELGPGRGVIARVAKHLGSTPRRCGSGVRDDDKGKLDSLSAVYVHWGRVTRAELAMFKE